MRASSGSIRLVATGSLLALALASCGSSPSGTPNATQSSGPCNTGSTKTVTIPSSERSPSGTSGTAPTVVVPTSAPPTQLECADLIYGSGASVKAGSFVTVQYVLATYSTHRVIQSSWTSQSFSFQVGANPPQVITGWDEGLIGMKVGGRRELIIPPSLGYGNVDKGGGVSANDTLVFDIDLLNSN
jgi:peptidylprolyl isomerase